MPSRVRGQRFGRVPAGLFKGLQISAGARVLYTELCTYADKNGICWPSHNTLADDLNVKPRTVQRWLRELETLGLLERVRNPNRRMKYRVNRKREDIPKIAASNRKPLEDRQRIFGIHGRRGAKVRHPDKQGTKVENGSPRGDNIRPEKAFEMSPEQEQEHYQSNSDAIGARYANYADGSAIRKLPDPPTDFDWNGWADWLCRTSPCEISQAHLTLINMVDQAKSALVTTDEGAQGAVIRILKIKRRSFPVCPPFAELLQREKDRRT